MYAGAVTKTSEINKHLAEKGFYDWWINVKN
jgi:hypothetical protein